MVKQKLTLFANEREPPLASLIILEMVPDITVDINWCDKTYIVVDNHKLDTDAAICRFIARMYPAMFFYGSSVLESVEIDQWISFTIGEFECGSFSNGIKLLNGKLAPVTYLVGYSMTIADIFLWSVIHRYENSMKTWVEDYENVDRWYSFIKAQRPIQKTLQKISERRTRKEVEKNRPRKTEKPAAAATTSTQRKSEGKFIQLPGAVQGQVVVRFPPEASGYLHIGHAKAALLNQYYRDTYNGKLIMRFDDTNPAKEKVDFEKVILEDLDLLKVHWDVLSHTSDYFDSMLEYCEQLLKSGDAYVDDTDAEIMKQEREQKVESKNRNNSVEKNMSMWQEMKAGSESGQRCCVRAKIDMSSTNGCLRDPTIYRCKNEPHPRTDRKYKVYPTYDFACPIVDSLEGVTHCLRTTEYHDRDEQFYWFIRKLGLREPVIWDYSRLNMTHTVLSKRKLTWFVEEGLVDGWDDPRLPTVKGIIRRGLTVAGLKEFIIAQGGSRSVVLMQWDKIWAINKKIIDPIAPRYTAVDKADIVHVNIKGAEESVEKVKLHPKNNDLGDKTVYRAPHVFIEQADAQVLKEGQTATFVSWGNVKILNIERKENCITNVEAELNLSDTNFKDTAKITWLSRADDCSHPLIPVVCVYFDHIITKAVLGKDEDFKNYVNKNTKTEILMHGESELRNVKKGDIIQLLRKGFFICDRPYESYSVHSCRQAPIVLFYIPDGHTKEVLPSNAALSATRIQDKDANDSGDMTSCSLQSQVDVLPDLKINENNRNILDVLNRIGAFIDEYKQSTGKKWCGANSDADDTFSIQSAHLASDLSKVIATLRDVLLALSDAKIDESILYPEKEKLFLLKYHYKVFTGDEWKLRADATDSSKAIAAIAQAEKIRSLYVAGADKSVIMDEIQKLISLKAEHIILNGRERVPNSNENISTLSDCITNQGNKVRDLKAAKADKSIINAEVQKLLALKAEFKTLTGEEWKPNIEIKSVTSQSNAITEKPAHRTGDNTNKNASVLSDQITSQGNKVRALKAAKTDKSVLNEEVQKLLALKAEFKALTGEEWKPNIEIKSAIPPSNTATEKSARQTNDDTKNASILSDEITNQGNKVRALKAAKTDKSVINEEVQKLLALKTEFKTLTGEEWKPNIEIKSATPQSNTTTEKLAQQSNGDAKNASVLSDEVTSQGNKVRDLKAAKADKSVINEEVQKLLALKAEFKALTGEEWKPNIVIKSASSHSNATITDEKSAQQTSDVKNTSTLSNQIAGQGNKVRSLKAAKADKSVINGEVQKLLALKAEFKTLTGEEWKPVESTNQQLPTTDDEKLSNKSAVNNESASTKSAKIVTTNNAQTYAGCKNVNVADKDLATKTTGSPQDVLGVLDLIDRQCNLLHDLQSNASPRELVENQTKALFALKNEFKRLTGKLWSPDVRSIKDDSMVVEKRNAEQVAKSDAKSTGWKESGKKQGTPASTEQIKKSSQEKTSQQSVSSQGSTKKQTRLGLETNKEENLAEWYSQVITKSELIEYYDVSGCYVLRPWAYAIWESIQSWFDAELKKLGVQNCYFPIFVSRNALEREKTHIADFAPEVAWVTKSGDSDLAEPIAIRPTSETVMYPAYAKWIQSYRDLPLKLNQWNNVVRWEFKHPQPFLRTREFLWQEGHTAFATMNEAIEEVYIILDLYAKVYTDLLAIPVVKGRKTEKEKFAGGDFTTTVEAFVAASGRGIQGATSHHLGQNFSKMFNIIFEDPESQEKAFVYQNSWGLTTRTIGVMIMIHADNQGLVLPPRSAAIQVIIVPCGIGVNTTDEEKKTIYDSCYELEQNLKQVGIKVKGDYRDNYSPGWKFNHWELKGVPIRIELGPKDIKERRLIAVRRDCGEKVTVARDQAVHRIKTLLDEIHEFLYKKAENDLQSHIVTCHNWSEFTPTLDKKNLILAPFCGETPCEDNIKQDSSRDESLEPGAPSMGAKSLCIPFEQPKEGLKENQKCIHHSCTNLAKFYVLFGRSY